MVPSELDGEEPQSRPYDARLLRRLLRFALPYRYRAAAALALLLLSSLLQLTGPLVTAVALDRFMGAPAPATAANGWYLRSAERWWVGMAPGEGLAWLAGIYLATNLAAFAVLYAQGYLLQMMGQRIMADLRARVFDHLQRLPVAYYDRNPVGRLVTRVTTDVDALNELFTAGLVSVFGDLLLLGGIAAVLFRLDWRLALVTFAILPLLLALSAWFKRRARQSFREVRAKIARINAFLQEHISGMPVVQLFGGEERAMSQFRAINDEHRKANLRAIYYYAVFYPGVELITALGVALILTYGGSRLLGGSLTLGALVAFLQYAQRFYQPLADLSEKYNILQGAMAASERIFAVLDTPAEIVSPPAAYCPRQIAGRVEFSGVGFAYEPGNPVLRDVSFTVEAGELVAVVGHTGAGKSTLANLLLRLYDVNQGSVRLDDRDVRDWDLDALRRGVGLVLQDVFLFAGSVRDNLRLGDPGMRPLGDERLRWAMREVGADDFVDRLPGGLGEPLRERGAGLSVGEKQLLAFARVLAFDPRVLVLDEATASIDSQSEARIQEALGRLLVRRTAIVIAHRLSTVQRADRILVLHHGELREQGTHRELLRRGGLYARLHRLQFAVDAVAPDRSAID
jgi:ATP-binding cassette subfamily B protein